MENDSKVIDIKTQRQTPSAPKKMKPKRIRLGDLLVANNKITEEQLQQALSAQKTSGHRLGRSLVDLEFLTSDELMEFLSKKLGVPYVDLGQFNLDQELVQHLPEEVARRCRAILLEPVEEGFRVGMDDPTNIFAFDELVEALNCPVLLTLVKEEDLDTSLDSIYRHTSEIDDFATAIGQELSERDDEEEDVDESISDAPVVQLLQHMFDDAVKANASDIHIEPDEDELRIRFRLDGILHVQTVAEKRIAKPVASRLKLMAGLDISEKRLPQDGRFNIKMRDKSLDVRVSTMPVQYGESVVMRLLHRSAKLMEIDQMGMPPAMAERLRQMVRSPHGVIFVTGPTGSGKTTTLYAALSMLNSPDAKIITVEDPVEYRLKGINQVQVNTKIDLTFARVLRTILRQDPDIVLVGEMRDRETVEIGLRAALTGHLVLSSLHTNDAVSTFSRLMDMGAEPFLIASTVRGVVAQRLVRQICDKCIEPDLLEPGIRTALEEEFGERIHEIKFYKGKGCSLCNNQGYNGRVGVYELLIMDDEILKAVHSGDAIEIAEVVKKQQTFHGIDKGYYTLKQSALHLAAQGKTTAEEVLRITYGMSG